MTQELEKPSVYPATEPGDFSNEIWLPVPNLAGYQASQCGRIKSNLSGSEKILSPSANVGGHLRVVLRINRRPKGAYVHRLVMRAFVGECPDGLEVLHLNHNSSDNRLCNLKYGTRKENIRADYESGARLCGGGTRETASRGLSVWRRVYENLEQRLFANSIVHPGTRCWIWIGNRTRRRGGAFDGRMNFREAGRHVSKRAHRVSFEEFRGPIPDGYEVDHKCRNTLCINPAHLEAVTPKVNKSRRVYKRRA